MVVGGGGSFILRRDRCQESRVFHQLRYRNRLMGDSEGITQPTQKRVIYETNGGFLGVFWDIYEIFLDL